MEDDKMYNLSKFVKENKAIQKWNLYPLLAKYESLIKKKKKKKNSSPKITYSFRGLSV